MGLEEEEEEVEKKVREGKEKKFNAFRFDSETAAFKRSSASNIRLERKAQIFKHVEREGKSKKPLGRTQARLRKSCCKKKTKHAQRGRSGKKNSIAKSQRERERERLPTPLLLLSLSPRLFSLVPSHPTHSLERRRLCDISGVRPCVADRDGRHVGHEDLILLHLLDGVVVGGVALWFPRLHRASEPLLFRRRGRQA